MKNKVFAILTVLVLCLSMVIPVSAAGTHIFDENGYVSDIGTVEAMAQNIEDTYGYSVLLAIVDSTGDGNTKDYSYELCETKATKENSVALTYDYVAQRYAFWCSGEAEALFPENVQKSVWDAFAYTETYYDGAVGYYNAVESILKENNVTVDTTPSQQETQADTEPVTESAASDRTLPLVTDNADILTDAEEAELSVKLKELGDKYDMDAAILTVDSYEGKTDRAYADDYFIEIGYGRGESKDGFLFVFNTGKEDGTRNVYLATHGSAIEYITDFEIDVIFEMVLPDLENGEYAAAFETLTSEVESAIDPSTPGYYIPLSIVIGFAIAFIIMKIQASKLKTVRKQVNAASYVANVQLTYQYDNFMYSDVSRVKRSNDSSSGGSSTHTSSSGDTFGGKGRNF
ncbi:MAG: TPM domain-containing protein [Clostridia bacterium]|nr:TPM domain-containing protein [Clostridia bacterium]